ncbi:MAG TPA: DinB family protein [Gemmatimonadaceae bacterium]|jgi:hypothetical protein
MTAPTFRDSARASMTVLERLSTDLVGRIERETSEAERRRKPSPNAWSLAQVTQHLALVSNGMLRTARPRKRFLYLGDARLALLTLVLRSPLRIPAPAAVIIPAPDVTWSDARGNIVASVERWKNFVESEAFDATRFRHPIVGALSPAQTVQFLVEHFGHHLRQIDALFAGLGARDSRN